MPFQVPTLPELAERVRRAFRANLKGSDAALWPNNVAVSAKVMAGAVWESFGFLDYIAKQRFVSTAEGEWLERHGADYGIARLPATHAEGAAVFQATAGMVIPAGIVLVRADGQTYDVTAGATADGSGVATLKIRARVPGRAGNAAAGVVLSLAAARDAVATDGEVAAGGVGVGADVENDESLRARLLHRLQYPPHGGAAHDYVAWARSINGVTRVFVDPVTAANGRTSVGVWFLMDDLYANGVPQPADVERVASYIDSLRPAGALVQVQAPQPQTVNVAIDNLSPDTAAVRDAVTAELRDLFRREVKVSTTSEPFILHVSKLWGAVSNAAGEDSHLVTAPAADISVPAGRIAVLGTVTFA
ncbi:MAG: baseplate J/gp47 family protein [Hyphomicrobiales bacterium]|nr:baseplate J/gp47 family protein [Hyphomicrobiales bacterium]